MADRLDIAGMPLRAAFVACVVVSACGELSSNPGADAGPESTRFSCESALCLQGSLCLSGECSLICAGTSAGCLADEFCRREGQCIRETVHSCEQDPCLPRQTCVGGYCLVLEPETCDESHPCVDGAQCVASIGRCVEAPPCGRFDTCPPFELGAICDTTVPGQRNGVCLIGRCWTDSDCPPSMACVTGAADAGTLREPGGCRARR